MLAPRLQPQQWVLARPSLIYAPPPHPISMDFCQPKEERQLAGWPLELARQPAARPSDVPVAVAVALAKGN